jgi:hypothetical protein
MSKVKLGLKFQVDDHEFEIVEICDHPNMGLIVVQEDKDPSIFRFRIPAVLIENLLAAPDCHKACIKMAEQIAAERNTRDAKDGVPLHWTVNDVLSEHGLKERIP